MLGALARAGSQLGDSRYLAAARRTLGAARKARFSGRPTATSATWPARPSARRRAGLRGAGAFGCREFARAASDRGADALAARLLARLDREFYDPAGRRYFGAPPGPAPGIFVRPFASGDPPGAEALALLAGAPGERAGDIAARAAGLPG